jgi:crotonobetainyl-CoA:carnitine CoA-transferase CaiB-like acyl-CoA transferase
MFNLLDGVRVIESALLLNGDCAGMVFGDLGAEVIKVEAAPHGDYIRDILGQVTPRNSPAHLQVNKNKKSLGLDVRTPEGKEVFFKLLQTADIFLDGFRACACDKLGIGYEDQIKAKPDIVYVQYSGFGSEGPYASIATHGKMMNALAGGQPARMDDEGLVRPHGGRWVMGGTENASDASVVGASYVVAAAFAALRRRDKTGKGAFIDLAGSDVILATGWLGMVYSANYKRMSDTQEVGPKIMTPNPQSEAGAAKYQTYETCDKRYIMFCCIEAKFWNNFCRAIGKDDWLVDLGSPVEFSHDTNLRRELQKIFWTRPQAEWIELARTHDIAMGPAHNLDDVPSDPHVKSRGVIGEHTHPTAGPFTHIGYPAIVDGERYGDVRPAPAFAQDTDRVLADLGYSAGEIDALKSRKVVAGCG